MDLFAFISGLPNEVLWFGMMAANFGAILLLYRFTGKLGLYVWVPIAAIVANIQVMKEVEIFGMVATLGNIVYATSFLVTDILSENYGKQAAKKAVYFGFFSLIVVAVLMNMALWFTPTDSDWASPHLTELFSFFPQIVVASLAAYIISQLHDVWAYDFWKSKWPEDKFIAIRNNLSTMVSQLIDTIVFSVIAFTNLWDIPGSLFSGQGWTFEAHPYFWSIFVTTYVLKFIVAAMDTPLVYIAKKWFEESKVPEGEI